MATVFNSKLDLEGLVTHAIAVGAVQATNNCITKFPELIKVRHELMKYLQSCIWKNNRLITLDTVLKDITISSITTDTEGREDCPVINKHCESYSYQCDRNGEVTIEYCTHPGNPDDHEGNCNDRCCPIN